MTWIVVGCAAVAVAIIVLALRAEDDAEDTGPAPDEPHREPKPGEGMRRVEHVENVPHDYVVLRPSLPSEEAYVVHGLLSSNGISSALVSSFAAMTEYARQAPMTMSVAVFRGQADEAADLLREAGVGGPP